MKKVLMVLVAAMLMIGMATGANAGFVTGDFYKLKSVNPVRFYLVDWGVFDNTIVMTATTENDIGYLQYSLDNIKWSSFIPGTDSTSGTTTITTTSASRTQLMYLRYYTTPNVGNPYYDYDADYMKFTSWTADSGSSTDPKSLDLFTGLIIRFSGAEITFASNADNDKFAAPVPVPPAIYLLGAGLLGLVGLRRRLNK